MKPVVPTEQDYLKQRDIVENLQCTNDNSLESRRILRREQRILDAIICQLNAVSK